MPQRVWTVVYDTEQAEALPTFALVGGQATVSDLFELIGQMARLGEVSWLLNNGQQPTLATEPVVEGEPMGE